MDGKVRKIYARITKKKLRSQPHPKPTTGCDAKSNHVNRAWALSTTGWLSYENKETGKYYLKIYPAQ